MTHLDPLQLLQLSVPRSGVPSEEDIRRAKRKLMAEFELAGTVTIHRMGRDIDRSTALQAMESLEDPATLANWVALHRMPAVRDLIHHPQAKAIQKLPALATVPEGAFRNFVREQLVAPLTALMDRAVRGQQWVHARQVLWRLEWVPYRATLRVVAPLTRHLWRMIMDLKALARADAADLDRLWNPAAFDQELAKTINAMPADVQYVINRLGGSILVAATHFLHYKGHDSVQARVLMAHAIRLRIDHPYVEEVQDLHAYLFYGLRVPYQAREIAGQNRRHARALFWVMWVLAVLAAAIRIWTDWLPIDIEPERPRYRYQYQSWP
jgi:hypothetical protein